MSRPADLSRHPERVSGSMTSTSIDAAQRERGPWMLKQVQHDEVGCIGRNP